MKLLEKINLLRWVKRKYKINVPFVKRNLSEEDFDRLLQSFAYLKEIGGIYDASKLVEEFIKERGLEYKPRVDFGGGVSIETYFNIHQNQEDSVRVFLRHLLLGEGLRASRENLRLLTKVLKTQGHEIEYDVPIDTKNFRKEAILILTPRSKVSLPEGLKKYNKQKEMVDVTSWIEENRPHFYYEGESLSLDLNPRWLCHYRKRFIDLFEMSEFPYLYKGEKRGFYERCSSVEMVCHLAFRDVFASYSLDQWIRLGISHESTSYTSEQEERFFSLLKEYILYNTRKVTLNSKPLEINEEKVYGWVAVLVLHYVKEAILKGKE